MCLHPRLSSSTGWTPPKSRLEEGVRGLHLEDVAPETQAVMSKLHLNREATNPLVMPIYNSTTYLINSVADYVGIIQGVSQAIFFISPNIISE